MTSEVEVEVEEVKKVKAVGMVDGIEVRGSEESVKHEVLSNSNTDVSTVPDKIKIHSESPVIQGSTVSVKQFEDLKSSTINAKAYVNEDEVKKRMTLDSSDSRMGVDSEPADKVCVGVCVSVTVNANSVRTGRDDDVLVKMSDARSSDRASIRTLTNNNSNNNINENHYSTSYDNNDDVNNVNNNDSGNNKYIGDRKSGLDSYYGKSAPMNQELGDSQRDFLDTIMA